MFASNGILFNHESLERRNVCTRKITIGISKIINGIDDCLYLGNIYALRDWGHAKIMLKCVGKFFNVIKVMISL